jgi:enoyl-CoA hydratase/carnithine racemase
MAFATIEIERDGPVELIRLNRPDALNALSLTMKDELAAALTAAIERPTTRAVLLTGAGRAFCAGADLRDLAPETGAAFRDRLAALQAALITRIRTAPKVVLAAVNGPAVGGGFSLAAACDVLLAADTAYFLAPQARLGLAADLGLTALLPPRIGAGRTRALLLTGARLDAARAEEWGLVHEVLPAERLLGRAREVAEDIATAAPLGVASTKRLLDLAADGSWSELLAAEAAELALLRATADHAEAVAAFAERRPPAFRGT